MNDEYQTQYFWNNMKKSELKELIKEQLFKALLEKDNYWENDGPPSIDGSFDDPKHFEKAMDNLGMRAGVKPSTGANQFRTPEQTVLNAFKSILNGSGDWSINGALYFDEELGETAKDITFSNESTDMLISVEWVDIVTKNMHEDFENEIMINEIILYDRDNNDYTIKVNADIKDAFIEVIAKQHNR